MAQVSIAIFFHFTLIYSFNPILHTAWLDSRALTFKNYTAKYYEVKKM
jgi:hypothetical protein